jgi:maltose O-acetyltransferase
MEEVLSYRKYVFYNAMANLPLLPWRIRRKVLRYINMSIMKNSYISGNAFVAVTSITIGEDVYINEFFLAEGSGAVSIGNGVRIGPRVQISTSTHELTRDPRKRASQHFVPRDVSIEDGVWIGMNVTILPGCTISEGCVIAAGSVVTKSTEANGLYGGVPAKLIRRLND